MESNDEGDSNATSQDRDNISARGPNHPTVDRSLSEPMDWPTIGAETRPWTRWWWMGSAVETGNLRRELSQFQDVGIGGVEITPIYGIDGEEHRFIDYLSSEWLTELERTVGEANHREIGVDMVPGTGWHFGGPSVDFEHSAMTLESETFELEGEDPFEAEFDPNRVQAVVAYSADDRTVELTDRIDEDGRIEWCPSDDGESSWQIVTVSGVLGRSVKRASPDREGPMINPYAPEAMRHYLTEFDNDFAGYDGPPLRGVFHDSFEYDASWSPVLLDAFEEQCGYRLQEHLPALLSNRFDETASRVTADYRRTLSNLFAETVSEWRRWAHENDWLARFQAHCAPGHILDLYALSDIPETEFINEKRNLLGSKLASSAAHVTGTRLVSAETATWLNEHFTVSLAEIKAHVDQLFLAGVNHVVYHGTAYSPDDAPWPGWLFYASTQLNSRNPIWHDLRALNEYVTRCQSVLQFGEPDADVLLYWPVEDVWHEEEGLAERLQILQRDWFESYPFGRVSRWLWENGYSVDYVSDQQLRDAVGDGCVELPGGRYQSILVPETEHMPVETLRNLLDLAETGTTVGFQRQIPDDVPGLGEIDQRQKQLGELMDRLEFSQIDGTELEESRLGDGQILVGDVEEVMPRIGGIREPIVDKPGLQFERRRFTGGTHYFVVNTGSEQFDGWVPLSVDAEDVAMLDPMTNETTSAAWRNNENAIEVRLQLAPNQSIVLRTFFEKTLDDNVGQYWTTNSEPVPIDSTWQIDFIRGGPERPPSTEMDELHSWTELGEPYQRFAGTARYTATFDRPATGEQWWLDLGTVHESARIWLNGQECDTVISPPYRFPIDELDPEENTLQIEVTNLAANRIRDLDQRGVEWKYFQNINFVDRDYEPFDASDWPVRPSGLLGPVRLLPKQDHAVRDEYR
jgi:hypothetical protein